MIEFLIVFNQRNDLIHHNVIKCPQLRDKHIYVANIRWTRPAFTVKAADIVLAVCPESVRANQL